MKTRMIAGAVLLALAPALAGADELASLAPGTRVRVTADRAGSPRLIGTIVAVDEELLTLMNDSNQKVTLPRNLVKQAEMSWGRRGHGWQGLLAGAALGTAMGFAEGDTCDRYACYTRHQNALYGGIGLAVIGALIGRKVKTDRWAGIELRVRPTGASMSVRF